MEHVIEFADLIRSLGGVPVLIEDPVYCKELSCCTNPKTLLEHIVKMEQEVATNYASRLRDTHEMKTPEEATVHVFYEDQIKHSQMQAWEVIKMLTAFTTRNH